MNPKCENPEEVNPESGKSDNGPNGEPSLGVSQENQEADRIKCVWWGPSSVGKPCILQIVSKSGLLRMVGWFGVLYIVYEPPWCTCTAVLGNRRYWWSYFRV